MIKFTGEECIYDENGRNVTTIKDFWACVLHHPGRDEPVGASEQF